MNSYNKIQSTKKNCPCCKKDFLIPDCDSWAYKLVNNGSYIYFCSWTCIQKSRNTKREMKKKAQIERELRGCPVEGVY